MNGTEPQSYQEFDSLSARLVGVIHSPRALLRAVIARPRWADVMAVTFAVSLASGVALMMTEVGQQALVDQLERTALAFGQEVDDAQYAEFQAMSRSSVWYAAVRALASGPLLAVGASALLYGLFTMVGKGDATYQQMLAVMVHAGAILALRQVISTPINYSYETLSSPATLTMFAPMLDAASPAARFFGAIDLFVVWWLVVLALGVSMLYRRPVRRTTAAFVGAYLGFAVLLAIAMVVSGGTV
jgi:hypothetical protein